MRRRKLRRRSEWATFQDFARAFQSRFYDPDFQYTLRTEILRRTQGEREPVADYLTCIRGLLDRLVPPWSMIEKIHTAYRNMLPKLQMQVRLEELTSFDRLENVAMRVERLLSSSSFYQAPPPPDKSLISSLAYQGSSYVRKRKPEVTRAHLATAESSDSESDIEEAELMAAIKVISKKIRKDRRGKNEHKREGTSERSKNKDKPEMTCWNCGSDQHLRPSCDQPLKIVCWGCGKTGVKKPDCPKCSKNEQTPPVPN